MQRPRLRILSLFLTITILLCFESTYALSQGDESFHFYIYGSYGCPHCRAMKEHFAEWYGEQHVFFCPVDRAGTGCVQRFYTLCRALGLELAVPLILVIKNNSVVTIVQGEVDNRGFWDALLSTKPSRNVSIYFGPNIIGYVIVKDLANFSKSVAPEVVSVGHVGSIPSTIARVYMRGLLGAKSIVTELTGAGNKILPVLVGLALADAVNPCTLYIYTLLLIAAALAAGYGIAPKQSEVVKKPLLCGLAFVAAIYSGYLALGLGLTAALRIIAEHTWIFGLVAIAFGGWTIATGIAKKSRIVAKGTVLDLLHKASVSPILSFALGLLLTFTLLPCSAGPYVVFAGLLASYPLALALGYLALYNLVFVSPLLAILIIVVLTMRIESVQYFILEHSSELSILAGALLIAIGIYVVLKPA